LLREHGAAASDAARGTPSVSVMLVAGGTDLFPNMKRRQFTPQVLVSLGRVKGSREITNGPPRARESSGLRIAAGATLSEVAAHPTVRAHYAALAQAAGVVSTPQLRNMGTLGGNLCLDTRCNWYDQSLFWRTAEGYCMKTHPSVVCRVAPSSARCLAVASADTVPALIALGAKVTVENADGRRELDLAELYREDGIRYLAIGRDDVVVSVTLPDATGWRSTYMKLRDRNSFDFPIAGVAAAVRFDGDRVTEARIAITAVASRPVAVDATALVGTKLDDDAIAAAADAVHKAARPMDNTSGTISQRKRAARVFTERALRSLRDA
ncbi:MAG TPA: FAD binding domain-containing protein, partial [Candidatus Limnocylindria bacterium]